MRDCFRWFKCLRHGGISAAAGGALLLCAAARAEDSPALTNTASLHGLVQRARAGQADAMLALADHLMAKGDLTNAAGWYRAGAKRGDPKAQQAFAQCLASGRGVTTNLAEATRWSHLAAKALNSLPGASVNTATNSTPAAIAATTPPSGAMASSAPVTGFNALLAAIAPTPLKVAAREPVVTPAPLAATSVSTNASAPMAAATVPNPSGQEPELPAWRIRPEEIGAGIHFQRATDLPPLTPSVQEEPAVIRPPDGFR